MAEVVILLLALAGGWLVARRDGPAETESADPAAAATHAERGDLAFAAAEYFRQAAAIVSVGLGNVRAGYRQYRVGALYLQGLESGDNAALLGAIAGWREVLALRPRERVPLDWAGTQNNLGSAFWTLGMRESGTARLEEAEVAYRTALDAYQAAQAGYYVAMVEGNLREVETLLAARRR